jgi:hypothetical protein
LLTLKSTTLGTMLANDCQALLLNYINNTLVGGTPFVTYGTMAGEATLIFCLPMCWLRHKFYSLFTSDRG